MKNVEQENTKLQIQEEDMCERSPIKRAEYLLGVQEREIERAESLAEALIAQAENQLGL